MSLTNKIWRQNQCTHSLVTWVMCFWSNNKIHRGFWHYVWWAKISIVYIQHKSTECMLKLYISYWFLPEPSNSIFIFDEPLAITSHWFSVDAEATMHYGSTCCTLGCRVWIKKSILNYNVYHKTMARGHFFLLSQ